jgi:hypothetical protein
MTRRQELTDRELDSVCGGSRSNAEGGGSDAASAFLKWLLAQLHIPGSAGGPILK